MSIHCFSMIEYNEDDQQDSLFLNIPEEMFLHICSFLDFDDIIKLSRTCRKFYCILQSENIWKSWIAARWNGQNSILENYSTMTWKKFGYHLESESKIWQNNLFTVTTGIQLSDTDAVLLFDGGTKCLTGSRDRYIMIWDVSGGREPINIGKYLAHEGWVWRLKKMDTSLYSSSWDYSIKLWNLDVDLIEKQQFKCGTAVLSMNVDQNGIIYGGTFNRIYAFDPRSGPDPVLMLESRIAPILTLEVLHGDLISGSENQPMMVWDIRTMQLKQKLNMERKNYAMCSQISDDILYVGDRTGRIRLYSSDSGIISEKAVIDIGFNKAISALNVNLGSILASCNNLVKVFLPLLPVRPINTFSSATGLICSMNSLNGRIGIGTASTVEFYLPRSND